MAALDEADGDADGEHAKAAEDAERAHVERVLRGEPVRPPERKEVPKYEEWADQFVKLAAAKNKPSEVASKEMVLRVHLKPSLGEMRLDQIGFAVVQDYVAAKLARGLSKKTINNHHRGVTGRGRRRENARRSGHVSRSTSRGHRWSSPTS
jgi:hypothetical protein